MRVLLPAEGDVHVPVTAYCDRRGEVIVPPPRAVPTVEEIRRARKLVHDVEPGMATHCRGPAHSMSCDRVAWPVAVELAERRAATERAA